MDKRLVYGYSLGNSLSSVVATLVVGQMKGFQTAVVRLEVFGDSLATSEAYFVGIEVKHFESVILEKVLHDDVETVVT